MSEGDAAHADQGRDAVERVLDRCEDRTGAAIFGVDRAQDVPIEKGEPLASELASFVSCVATRDQPVVSGRHASDALKLAVEITQFIAEAKG